MRQLIIARKDLGMSQGKLAAQCCHASLAFLSKLISDGIAQETDAGGNIRNADPEEETLHIEADIRKDVYEEWLNGIFKKTICEAKNKYQLMKAVTMAEEMGMKEDRDFFLIKDYCFTEIEPEEIDENGVGRTLTCIGFRPLPDEIAHKISKKYNLYKQ